MLVKPFVWIVGFPRCGSASLCEALHVLGWNPIHNPRHWDQLEKHNAAGDVMITAHWRELNRMFPNSRFILNTRPYIAWVKSLQRIPGFWQSEFFYDRYYHEKVYGGCTQRDSLDLRRIWELHHEQVRDTIPADRLLEIDVTVHHDMSSTAWASLCKFFEMCIPDQPFPWLNKASNQDAKIRMNQT